nr:zinc finger, CCHC-type [Tanacetum cinerariifolium]
MENENRIRTLGDYSKPSYEGYRNTIELPDGNNVVPLRSDTIRLVQNGCAFHELRSEDPNQHLKDFLKLVDSLDLDVANRERTCLHLFLFLLRDHASNWLERFLARSISTWEDLTTRFLAQFFPLGRTTKLQNNILMFQQHQDFSWVRIQTFTSPQDGSFSTYSSSYQTKIERVLSDFDSRQERKLSCLGTQLRQQQDDMINRINTLWRFVSEKFDNTHAHDTARNSMACANSISIDSLDKEAP